MEIAQPQLVAALEEHALGRPTLRTLLRFRVQRIESLEAFRDALGDPRTITCFGNGPSSENGGPCGHGA